MDDEQYERLPKDIVIRARDENLYRLRWEEYTSNKVDLSDDEEAGMMNLLAHGTVLGSVPNNVGTACYLLSLTAIENDNVAYNMILNRHRDEVEHHPEKHRHGRLPSGPDVVGTCGPRTPHGPEHLFIFTTTGREPNGALYQVRKEDYVRHPVPAKELEVKLWDQMKNGVALIAQPVEQCGGSLDLRYGVNLAIIDLPPQKARRGA